MKIDYLKKPVLIKLDPGMLDRSLPLHLLGFLFLRLRCDLLVPRSRCMLVLVLVMFNDLITAEYDKVTLIVDLCTCVPSAVIVETVWYST